MFIEPPESMDAKLRRSGMKWLLKCRSHGAWYHRDLCAIDMALLTELDMRSRGFWTRSPGIENPIPPF